MTRKFVRSLSGLKANTQPHFLYTCLLKRLATFGVGLATAFGAISAIAIEPYTELTLVFENQTDVSYQDHQVHLSSDKLSKHLSKDFLIEGMSLIYHGKKGSRTLDSQAVDLDMDGTPETLVFNHDFPAKKTTEITLAAVPNAKLYPHATKPRAQVDMGIKVNGQINDRGWYIDGIYRQVKEIAVPPSHVRGNRLFRYEGFGWESDKVGYRYYFDARSTIDIFGKRLSAMVLQDVGHMGDSYHKPSEWGVDVLKVGKSLGLGSLGTYEDGQAINLAKADGLSVSMIKDGPLLAKLHVHHENWPAHGKKVKVQEAFSIAAGSRLTKADVTLNKSLKNIATGIVKVGLTPITSNDSASEWGYMATYGLQSLANDNLGMVIFFRTNDVLNIVDDDYNHLVVLKPNKKHATYYFGAAWEQEFDGIQNAEQFEKYLEDTRIKLNNPLKLDIKPVQH